MEFLSFLLSLQVLYLLRNPIQVFQVTHWLIYSFRESFQTGHMFLVQILGEFCLKLWLELLVGGGLGFQVFATELNLEGVSVGEAILSKGKTSCCEECDFFH